MVSCLGEQIVAGDNIGPRVYNQGNVLGLDCRDFLGLVPLLAACNFIVALDDLTGCVRPIQLLL